MKKILSILIVSAALLSAEAGAQVKYSPAVTGPYRVLFKPDRTGDTINDHTVFQDIDGNWRMIGIVSKGLNILNTPSFAHGAGSSLDYPLEELDAIFADYPDRDKKWAPHVIIENGVYHLFAGPQKIRHYTSPDGIHWTFKSIVIQSDWKDLRDTMVLKIAPEKFLMYVTWHYNSVAVYESSDLENWIFRGRVFVVMKPAPVYPAYVDISVCESPFVIFYEGYYYLSTCMTSGFIPRSYSNTVIVRSADPYNFGVYAAGAPFQDCDYVTTLSAHAAEFIHDQAGRWYITSAGWREYPTPKDATRGALNIAPLTWEKQ